ncbi:hypothetical protein [Bartonella bovis]|uniref:Uncharacterized protein n=1 Tax=Bartonella bovis 91-4 TaxID=1094491 RepID=N6UP40_9HYPH|nr:hypothetical protein [Bartonella bovis]ENN91943.1 hypothetical protein BBbe_02430 [Bartonella bovis 91-4]
MKKRFFGTVHGHETLIRHDSWTTVSVEYFYNLYECEDGKRTFEAFRGRCYYDKDPDNANFSMMAQISAWIHGGDLPKTINTLNNSTN